MKKRGDIEISFSWLFAIIVGAFILFIAIYGVSKLAVTQKYVIDTETAKKLSIIFDPMETSLASGKATIAYFTSETKIYNTCSNTGLFGKQKFSLSAKYGLGKRWSDKSGEISVVNKYVLSDNEEQGKSFFFFSKPFEFPFKVSEIIFMSGKKYCFVNPPNFIEEEINWLNSKGIKDVYVSNGTCLDGAEVCFSGGNCDINVIGSCSGYNCESDFDYGYVVKNRTSVSYYKSLIYAAIFSSPEIYECNVKRLMKRAAQIAYLYNDEAVFLTSKGCGSEMSSDLLFFGNQVNSINSSSELILLKSQAEMLETKNSALECNLW